MHRRRSIRNSCRGDVISSMGKLADNTTTTADVYKMADVLLRQHGKDAVLIANMRAGEMLNVGDLDGYRTWKRLVMLVDGMTEDDLPDGINLH